MLPAKEPLPNPLSDPLGAAAAIHRNSWNHFAGRVSAAVMRDTADRFVALGLRDAGYVYINSDDTWAELNRSASGRLVPKPSFGGPGDAGIRALCAAPLAPSVPQHPTHPALHVARRPGRTTSTSAGSSSASVRTHPISSTLTHPPFPCPLPHRWRRGVDDLRRIRWESLPRARGRGDTRGVGR